MAEPRKHAGERGAVAVEFALILPVLLLILFGIIEWSLAFKDTLTIASATRTGARTASAEPRSPTFADDTARSVARAVAALPNGAIEALWVYKAGADGKPVGGGGFTTCTTCVKYSWNAGTNAFVRQGATNWDPVTQNACAGTSDAVGVYLRANHAFLTGYFPPAVTLTDHTVMVLEPVPAFQGCK